MKRKEEQVRLVQRGKRKYKKYEKEQDEIERLEKEIRELKAINRSLLKQIKKLSKGVNRQEYEDALEVVENGSKKEDNNRIRRGNESSCTECSKGRLEEINIAGRVFHRCSTCGYRSGRVK